MNSVCFSLIWICAPILVSVTSFFVYVLRGHELTVGTAFTVSVWRMWMKPFADVSVVGDCALWHGQVGCVMSYGEQG